MYAPLEAVNRQPFNEWFVPDATQRFPLLMRLTGIDPYWGYGEFVYGQAANALNKGNICVAQATFGQFDKTPNTANLGQNQVVAMNEMAASSYGWFLKSGLAVVKSTATVAAAAAVGISGAGTIGANAAGKQVMGYTQLQSQTATKVFANVQTLTGSSILRCPGGYDGMFLGGALSGTGIPASTLVAKLDPDGMTVYMGSAIGTVDKIATATGAVSVTQTNTGYSIAMIDSPFGQGAIT